MPRISTHVLDTSRGMPAQSIIIELYLLRGAERRPVATAITNADGRTDAPLITGEPLDTGIYEMVFRVTDYLLSAGVTLTSPPFLGDIVVRFGVGDGTKNYHVPLLLSPYGYSTYRGS